MNATNRVSAGVPTGGEFATHNRSESDTTLTEVSVKHVIDNLIARDAKYSLVFIDRDESLTDEQCSNYLAGDRDEFYDAMLESFSERSYDTATELAEEECRNLNLERFDVDDDDWQMLVEEITNRDDSDPIKDIIHGTHAKLMRAPIAKVGAEAYGTGATWGDSDGARRARINIIEKALEKQGVECTSSVISDVIEPLVDNGPHDWHEGVDLDVIWHGPIGDATMFRDSHDLHQHTAGRKLTFQSPEILLFDKMNGSGTSVRLPGALSVTVTKDAPANLDSQTEGYGFDEIAGLNHSAFRQDVASEWVEKQPEPASA